MRIVLYQPEIPQNTGNIARTCAATGVGLDLVEPLGFSLSDRYLKRAGLDYWHLLDVQVFKNFEALLAKRRGARLLFTSTKAKQRYTDIAYQPDDLLVFGPESRGLPESLLEKAYHHTIRIPMRAQARSLNLSNAAAVVVYEALRQRGFENLLCRGALTGRSDPAESWMDRVGGESL